MGFGKADEDRRRELKGQKGMATPAWFAGRGLAQPIIQDIRASPPRIAAAAWMRLGEPFYHWTTGAFSGGVESGSVCGGRSEINWEAISETSGAVRMTPKLPEMPCMISIPIE